MSVHFIKAFCLILVCWAALCATVNGEEWMRGAVALTTVAGEVSVAEIGSDPVKIQAEDVVPLYFSGLLKVESGLDGSVFLQTSNRISIYNEGAGFFAIERFEQDIEESMDQGKSRMILNLRQGMLVVDNRALSEDSQMIVETPIGRISVKNGWWMIRIRYDDRSRIYDVSIECADGVMRFTDKREDTYTLRKGQRLRGAGASARLSIEVGEISDEAGELFEEFALLEADTASLGLSSDAFRLKMRPLNNTESNNAAAVVEVEARSNKRPMLIEYAPQSKPVTPFRAVIYPPTGYQADLF
jgi:hypothetical protein